MEKSPFLLDSQRDLRTQSKPPRVERPTGEYREQQLPGAETHEWKPSLEPVPGQGNLMSCWRRGVDNAEDYRLPEAQS